MADVLLMRHDNAPVQGRPKGLQSESDRARVHLPDGCVFENLVSSVSRPSFLTAIHVAIHNLMLVFPPK